MTFHLCWPDEEAIRAKGFGRVAHVPFIFAEDWSYHRLSSTYLIERALLDWIPGRVSGFGSTRFPTESSLQAFGDALCNFLEWVELRGLDWRQLEYIQHVVEGYQAEMLRGSWSVRGTALSASTVNGRVQEACNFLTWAFDRGLRKHPFEVKMDLRRVKADVATNSHGHRSITVESRIGRVRPPPKELRLPLDSELARWLSCVHVERGHTKRLMCELILNTGIRRAEAAAWRVDTLPLDRNTWDVVGHDVMVNIKYGAKGQSYGKNHGDKIGPARKIAIPMVFAERLSDYLEFSRPQARRKWVNSAADLNEKRSRLATSTPHLFLSEYDGERITDNTLYEAWTGVTFLPYEGWSPHPGRHFWACKTLLELARKRSVEIGASGKSIPVDWAIGNASADIMLVIKPQLGHIDLSTTECYLQWLRRIVGHNTHEKYEMHLDIIGNIATSATPKSI